MSQSNVAKGNYHVRRTREWLESLGYDVGPMEHKSTLMIPDKENPGKFRPLFKVHDVWGADLIAKNEEDIVMVQVKANPGHVAEGCKDLLAAGPWPPMVKLWCVNWPIRRLMKVGPDITEVTYEPETQGSLFKKESG